MPAPWEAFIPIGLVVGMFGAAGVLLSGSRYLQNQGKPPRHSVDKWDAMMMERDRRLTGHARGQSSEPIAPPEFATNSKWKYVQKLEGINAWMK